MLRRIRKPSRRRERRENLSTASLWHEGIRKRLGCRSLIDFGGASNGVSWRFLALSGETGDRLPAAARGWWPVRRLQVSLDGSRRKLLTPAKPRRTSRAWGFLSIQAHARPERSVHRRSRGTGEVAALVAVIGYQSYICRDAPALGERPVWLGASFVRCEPVPLAIGAVLASSHALKKYRYGRLRNRRLTRRIASVRGVRRYLVRLRRPSSSSARSPSGRSASVGSVCSARCSTTSA